MADVAESEGRLWLVESGSRRRFGYHLLTDSGRAGSLRLFDRSRLATLESADGAWSVSNRSRTGWELLIRGVDGDPIGSFSGRRWRSGGTLSLADGREAQLLRTVTGTWKLRSGDAREAWASIRPSGRAGETRTAVMVHSLPGTGADAALMILVACAVVTLERSRGGVPTVSPAQGGQAPALARAGTDRRPG